MSQPMPARKIGPTYNQENGLVLSGLIAGFIAGIVMALFAMFVSLSMGQGFWTPMYLIGALFWGVNALVANAWAAVVGVIIHLAVSSMFGVIFAVLVPRTITAGGAFFAGLFYGIVIWALMNYIIEPWLNPIMDARTDLISGWWFYFHLAYGATLFLTPILAKAFTQQSLSGKVEDRPHIRRVG